MQKGGKCMAILPTWLDALIWMLAGAGIYGITSNLKKYFDFE
ncbi:Holin [Latilactobacillus sakei]|nr:putative membrane protein [Latilactobacillus curvatus CRL 705]